MFSTCQTAALLEDVYKVLATKKSLHKLRKDLRGGFKERMNEASAVNQTEVGADAIVAFV